MEKTLSLREFTLLSHLASCPGHSSSQRELSAAVGLSVGTVNKVVQELSAAGYVLRGSLTPAGLSALEPYRVSRAVIMAAGFGSRLVPITLNTPKPLVRVGGRRIIDTLLDAVLEAGIQEIYLVRGYLAEQFDQLLYKYPMIRFIENPLYNEANNISSALYARHLLSNAYMLEADLVIRNPKVITPYQYQTNYLAVPTERTDDWCFFTEGSVIRSYAVGGVNCHHMFGISYWTAEDGTHLPGDIEDVFYAPGGKERYFEHVVLDYHKEHYTVHVRECSFDDIVEIDTFSELKAYDKTYDV